MKTRVGVLFKFRELVLANQDELAKLIVLEHGKNYAEAVAEISKGLETVEWACSMPQLAQGHIMEVSRGITCRDVREPLGVVACIVPFNFPLMVPHWYDSRGVHSSLLNFFVIFLICCHYFFPIFSGRCPSLWPPVMR